MFTLFVICACIALPVNIALAVQSIKDKQRDIAAVFAACAAANIAVITIFQ